MKKILLLTVVLVALLSGQAMAYFENGNLIRVVYDRGGTYEVVTDLGSGWSPTAEFTGNQLFSTYNFSLSDLGLSSWDNVYVGYFIAQNIPSNGAWTSGNMTSQTSAARQWPAFFGNAGDIMGANFQSGNAQNVNLQSGLGSYQNNFGIEGRFSSFLPSGTSSPGDASLVGFDAEGLQYVDQKLYYYAAPNTAAAGLQVYTLRTYENGTTEINPVPVPAAVYLLGTGLLGLIGIRRKSAAA